MTNQKLRLTQARKESAAASARLAVEFTIDAGGDPGAEARIAFQFMTRAAVMMTAAALGKDCAIEWGQKMARSAWDKGYISRLAHNDMVTSLDQHLEAS